MTVLETELRVQPRSVPLESMHAILLLLLIVRNWEGKVIVMSESIGTGVGDGMKLRLTGSNCLFTTNV